MIKPKKLPREEQEKRNLDLLNKWIKQREMEIKESEKYNLKG